MRSNSLCELYDSYPTLGYNLIQQGSTFFEFTNFKFSNMHVTKCEVNCGIISTAGLEDLSYRYFTLNGFKQCINECSRDANCFTAIYSRSQICYLSRFYSSIPMHHLYGASFENQVASKTVDQCNQSFCSLIAGPYFYTWLH